MPIPEDDCQKTTKGTAMSDKAMTAHGQLHLERLKLAADVLLSERDDIPDALEVELTLFRDRVEHALLAADA
jgi:hypothetical protein